MSKDRGPLIEIGEEDIFARVTVKPAKSTYLSGCMRADEKIVDGEGNTLTFTQAVYDKKGRLHHHHIKDKHNEETYFGENGEVVMIIRKGVVVYDASAE